jgi:DinB family protein
LLEGCGEASAGAAGDATIGAMETASRALAASIDRAVGEHLPLLRAIPDGPETTRPNRPSGSGWSRREELGHLVDSAVNNHLRFVRASLDGAYAGPSYEADPWVAAHGYAATPWPAIVGAWEAHNAVLVPLVAAIPDARLAAPCTVGGDAPVTLAFLIDDYVLHMRHHLDQILRRAPTVRYPRA